MSLTFIKPKSDSIPIAVELPEKPEDKDDEEPEKKSKKRKRNEDDEDDELKEKSGKRKRNEDDEDDEDGEKKHPKKKLKEGEKPPPTVRYVYVDEEDESDTPVTRLDTELTFEALPYVEKGRRFGMFISGPSGAGKSTCAASCVEKFRAEEGKAKYPAYIITGNNLKDPALEDIQNSHYFNMEKREAFSRLKYQDLKDCICIFDDWERNGDLTEDIHALIRQLLEYSRKQNVAIIVITHLTQQGWFTKSIIFESDTYILFHKDAFGACRNFLKAYLHMDKDEIAEIKKLKGRYITVRKSRPSHITSKRSIMLI